MIETPIQTGVRRIHGLVGVSLKSIIDEVRRYMLKETFAGHGDEVVQTDDSTISLK